MKAHGMELRYKHVEAALAAVLEIKSKDMGAFRARLRHLRNLGLPKLPTPGSGRKIAYSERQAFEMLVALELEDVGLAPRSAATIGASIVRQHSSLRELVARQSEYDLFVAITPSDQKRWTALATRAAFDEYVALRQSVYSLIDLSVCASKLDRALRDVMTDG